MFKDIEGLSVNYNLSENKSENGSSLIAMAILIIVLGTMMNGFIFIYQNQELINKDRESVQKNQIISLALSDYLMRNGRLPCPAPLNAAPGTPFFGIEDPNENCSSGNYYNVGSASNPGANFITSRGIVSVAPLPPCGGGACRPGPAPGNVKIGTLPTRNLNIPDDYMVDGYGKRYIYVVTESLATPGVNPNVDLGAIDITDSAGNSLPEQRAHVKYIFFGPGIDDRGAYDKFGSLVRACGATGLARENCDWQTAATADATFVSSFFKTY